ncbi:uncharacterized protein LOC62_04G005855 [Vanrija pseudolonga]|uniref:Uncharacterized protein n=1 Tax=Vanrija pseudolonga TaxID=143232 RepID=A0AAF1BIJ2_9TREE|nr:hypothetical protein LOC62_04G005855 [Vanrija pseudolonga]
MLRTPPAPVPLDLPMSHFDEKKDSIVIAPPRYDSEARVFWDVEHGNLDESDEWDNRTWRRSDVFDCLLYAFIAINTLLWPAVIWAYSGDWNMPPDSVWHSADSPGVVDDVLGIARICSGGICRWTAVQ